MLSPPSHANEQQRIELLKALELLDSAPTPELDTITQQATESFDVPIALISLVDTDRQWFKSRIGLSVPETPRNISFCGYTILHEDTFLITDASTDVRFYDNPLVTGEPHIRFYAGVPLKINNYPIGSLCIIDSVARSFSRSELKLLRELGDKVEKTIQSMMPSLSE